jgi:SynChlorMet cassette protein ScmC
MKYEEVCYRLNLSNGLGWNLTAINGTGKWLDKLAYIMRLEQTEKGHLPKIIFCQMGDFLRVSQHYGSIGCDYGPGKNTKEWFIVGKKVVHTWFNNATSDVICEIDNSGSYELDILNMWFSLQSIYQHVQYGGGLPFHAALLELNGQGILLAANGDTGKSTCCRRIPDYWNPLCDDEALVVFDQENGYLAHPFPTWSEYLWYSSDKLWNVQYSVPICAIFFLEQAEGDEVIPLGEGLAAVAINRSAKEVSWKFWRNLDNETKRPLTIKQFHNACKIAKVIPSFTLRASLHGRFWEKMEKALANI